MNFALICDSSRVSSYKVQEGRLYRLIDGFPYIRGTNISNECTFGFWNYPVIFDGYFINTLDNIYPKVKFDVIFAAIEVSEENFNKIRQIYPEAVIFATIKEMFTQRMSLRTKLANKADGVVSPYLTVPNNVIFPDVYKEVYNIPQPVNIEYLQDNFLSKKAFKIFSYSNFWANGRSGANHLVLDNLGLPHTTLKTYYPDPNQALDFINVWMYCQIMLNTDPTSNFGQQATQCAALGVVMLGGENDSHKVLYPEFAHNDYKKLKRQIWELKENSVSLQRSIDYASRKLQEHYSFDAVRNKINVLYEYYR